ncbi:hypothetical protein OQA88_12658 [Cercophora sp. LCS_1]
MNRTILRECAQRTDAIDDAKVGTGLPSAAVPRGILRTPQSDYAHVSGSSNGGKNEIACDGQRPQCTNCAKRQLSCTYDGPDGLNWSERLKAETLVLRTRVSHLETLVDQLRTSTDDESALLFARLRLGEPLETLIDPYLSPSVPSPPPTGVRNSPSMSTASQGSRWPVEASFNAANQGPDPSTAPSRSASMIGDFLFPVFHRTELAHTPATLCAQNMDGSNETVVMLKSVDNPATYGKKLETILWQATENQTEETQPGRFRNLRRQQPRDQLRIHTKILGDFGNLPFSESIPANHYPDKVQSRQRDNLFVPRWAMMVVHTDFDGTLQGIFSNFLLEAQERLKNGVDNAEIIGESLHVSAIFDRDEFEKAPMLSKWAIRVMHSIMEANYNVTVFASTFLYWNLMRWMIEPSRAYFEAIPAWLRPVPNQLFMPHPMVVDFVLWPALREYVVQFPLLQVGMSWLLDMTNTLMCHWPGTTEDALVRNEGVVELTEDAKEFISKLENWSLGPTFRQYIPNADILVNIRT